MSADDAKALALYRQAAEAGDGFAQLQLGLKFARGEGVKQDYVQAHLWANLAATSGNPDAPGLRAAFAKAMTPEQIDRAQQLAREWTQKHR